MSTSKPLSCCNRCSFAQFCILEKTPALPTKHKHPLIKQYKTLKRHEVLCLPNNKFQSLYAIQEGALKTYQVEASGKELIRGFYFVGEVLGYEAIHTNQYLFSVVALDDTLICEIPYNNLLEFMHAKPSMQKKVLSLMSRQLNAGSYLAATNAEQRLAAFLIDLSLRLHSELTCEFILPMSRQDIGSYLRLTAETISRIFSRLQKNKIIKIAHKKINLLQIEKLKFVANGLLSVMDE